MNRFTIAALTLPWLAAAAAPSALAQTPSDTQLLPVAPESALQPPSVFDGDWLTLGVGAGFGASYEGSDDSVAFPFGLIAGKVKGVGITPRPAGLSLDLVPDGEDSRVSLSFGPVARIRSNRVNRIVDPVVSLLPRRKTAVEVGVAGGVAISGLLNPFDQLSFSLDAQWDIAGAHKGAVFSPGVSYATPLSRATFATLALSAEHVSQSYADAYFTVTSADATASGLPAFRARRGVKSLGAGLIVAHDLSGNLLDGGWSVFGALGYSRLLGDARRTPITSVRGSAEQMLFGGGISYTF
jgi:MipA family protein